MGISDIAFSNPDQWEGDRVYRENKELDTTKDFLSEDFCVLNGEHFFVRCVLQIPLLGAKGEYFAYGVWSTLSKKNFDIYVDTFNSGEQSELGPWFGWFSNKIKGYPDTLGLKCQVYPQSGRIRPVIELMDENHPLAIEARDGISYERLTELYKNYQMHELPEG
jgi:hypothetical protein